MVAHTSLWRSVKRSLECGHNGLVRVAVGVTIVITGLRTDDIDATVTR